MKRENRIKKSLVENLSGLYVTRGQHAALMNEITGGRKVKAKLKTSLVLVLILVLLGAMALALGLNYHYSSDVAAKSAAQSAVMEKYGLSQEAMDMFWGKTESGAEGTTVRFSYYDGVDVLSPRMGVYTVSIGRDGSTAATWSHDAADPAIWADGSLEAEVWGNGQILAYRAMRDQENREAIAQCMAAGAAQDAAAEETATPAPEGKLTQAQALALAAEAMKKVLGFSDEALTLFTPYAALGGSEAEALKALAADMDAQFTVPEETLALLKSYAGTDAAGEVWAVAYHPTLIASSLFHRGYDCPLGGYVVTLSDETGEAARARWSLEGVENAEYTRDTWGQAQAYDARMLPWALELTNICAPLLTDETGEIAGMPTGFADNAAYDQAFRDAGFDPGRYNHVLPEAGDISYEEAVEIVAQILQEEYGVSRAVFDASGFAYADLTQEEDHREWYFWVQNADEQCGWSVAFDAQTGEVLFVESDPFANSNG